MEDIQPLGKRLNEGEVAQVNRCLFRVSKSVSDRANAASVRWAAVFTPRQKVAIERGGEQQKT